MTLKSKTIARELLDQLENGEEPVKYEQILQVKEGIDSLRVDMEERDELQRAITKADEQLFLCRGLLDKENQLTLPEFSEDLRENLLPYLLELLSFKKNLRDLNIIHEDFLVFNTLLRPILIWIEKSRALIKAYHKSLDLQTAFTHLELLEPQDYKFDDVVNPEEAK